MMATADWAGFTEEDIRRMQPKSAISPAKKAFANDRGNPSVIQDSKPMKLNTMSNNVCYRILNYTQEDTGLTKLKPVDTLKNAAVHPANAQDCGENNTLMTVSDDNLSQCLKETKDRNKNVQKEKTCMPNESISPHTEENDEIEIKSFNSRSVLKAFEQRQKHMEFENARRKALISKAILDRKKRTQSEATKLMKIQKELNQLDSCLSLDVSILRNHIEQASLEFSEAEKRYLKAEKEFVDAKVVLFQRMERKEGLTEHLCAIIEQNEDRKANRLSELMQQLEMEADESHTNGISPLLSNLSALNDATYQNFSTIKPPPEKEVNL